MASLLNGIDRALTKRPVEYGACTFKNAVWIDFNVCRREHGIIVVRRPKSGFGMEIEAALRVGEWMRAIELIDQYVAEGWTYRSKTSQEHEMVILAQLRVESHFGMGDVEKVTAIASDDGAIGFETAETPSFFFDPR